MIDWSPSLIFAYTEAIHVPPILTTVERLPLDHASPMAEVASARHLLIAADHKFDKFVAFSRQRMWQYRQQHDFNEKLMSPRGDKPSRKQAYRGRWHDIGIRNFASRTLKCAKRMTFSEAKGRGQFARGNVRAPCLP